MKISIHHLFYTGLIILIGCLSIRQCNKPEVIMLDQDYQKLLDKNDSLLKVNDSLKVLRTIDIQEAAKLRFQLDSVKSIRPKNIKRTNDEVTRLHNSNTPGKLAIIDSILRSRKGQH